MKHAASTIWDTVEPGEPKHSNGWCPSCRRRDDAADTYRFPYTPGAHAKPFAKHHPATLVTYDAAGTATPLVTSEHWLDVVA